MSNFHVSKYLEIKCAISYLIQISKSYNKYSKKGKVYRKLNVTKKLTYIVKLTLPIGQPISYTLGYHETLKWKDYVNSYI